MSEENQNDTPIVVEDHKKNALGDKSMGVVAPRNPEEYDPKSHQSLEEQNK